MKQPLKYVNFYKRMLEKGCAQGFAMDGNLTLHLADPAASAAYTTAVFDTRDVDMTYNRLIFDGEWAGAKLEIIVACSDTLEETIGEVTHSLAGFLADQTCDPAEKAEFLCELPHVRAVNATDILLHGLKGRYVWVLVRVLPAQKASCTLRGLRLEFPKYSFTDYFPEIYRENDFFDRYIAIFQSEYLDAEKRVEAIPAALDYESASDADLAKLAGWLGIENTADIFSPAQLRELIRRSAVFQGGKGTRRTLEEIVLLAAGIRPRIVESFQWNRGHLSSERKKLLGMLYGEDENCFTVILDVSRRTAPLPLNNEQMERLVEAYSAMGTRAKLVYLRRCSNTDAHCYLDVNSCLATPETATLDGTALGGSITLG